MFLDLQGFVINKKFIVKEIAILKQGTVFIHYIFYESRGNFWHDLTSLACPDWVFITMDYDGRWFRTVRWNAWSWRLYLKMVLPFMIPSMMVSSKDARNEHGYGTCFWRWARTHVHRDLGCNLRRHGIFN